MSQKRQVHSAAMKAKAALESIKGYYTINELASKYSVHQVVDCLLDRNVLGMGEMGVDQGRAQTGMT